jgi:hypothetical protein
MYQYTVFFDYEKDGVWTYNEKFTTTFKDKGRHASAEWEAKEWIIGGIDCDSYRITKVYCD